MKHAIYYIIIIAIFCAIGFTMCEVSKEREAKERAEYLQRQRIGKYLYLSADGVLHSKADCFELKFAHLAEEEKVESVAPHGMIFIDTLEINEQPQLYCPNCFDDKKFEQVQNMIRRNPPKKSRLDMIIEARKEDIW